VFGTIAQPVGYCKGKRLRGRSIDRGKADSYNQISALW
jgi:hypothetical protein